MIERFLAFASKLFSYLSNKISCAPVLKQIGHPISVLKQGNLNQQICCCKNIPKYDISFFTNSKIFAIFWFLHHIFPPRQRVHTDESGVKHRKKHTVINSQESFAIIAEAKAELDVKINLLKLHIEPKLLIVGEPTSIKQIFIDFIKYPSLQIIQAIDILFRIFLCIQLRISRRI